MPSWARTSLIAACSSDSSSRSTLRDRWSGAATKSTKTRRMKDQGLDLAADAICLYLSVDRSECSEVAVPANRSSASRVLGLAVRSAPACPSASTAANSRVSRFRSPRKASSPTLGFPEPCPCPSSVAPGGYELPATIEVFQSLLIGRALQGMHGLPRSAETRS